MALSDAGRLATLARSGLMGTEAEPSFDRLTRLATRFLRVPVALVSLVDAERQFFKSCTGLAEPWASRRETPLTHSFCQHVVATGEPLVVRDARSDLALRDNLAIGDIGVVAYLGIPLEVDGHVVGSFCAIDGEPRDWTEEDVAAMQDLAGSVISEIRLRAETAEAGRQRLAAEAARQNAEVTLRSIGDGVIATDAVGTVTYINPVASRLCGWPRGEAIGRPVAAVFAIVEEGTGEPNDRFVARVLRSGEPAAWRDHTMLVARDGSRREIEESAAPILVEGRVVGAVVTFRDVGPRKAQAKALQVALDRVEALLSTGDVGTWDYDLATGVVAGDRNLTRIYGMEPAGPITGPVELFWGAILPEDRGAVRERVARAVESEDHYEAQYRVRSLDGAVCHVTARAQVRRDAAGRAVQLSGVVIDVTEQTRVQEQFRDAKARLDHLLSAGSVATWTWDVAADRLVADANLARLFRVSPAEAEGGQLAAYTRAIHPDDRDRVAGAIAAALESGSRYDEEYRVQAPGGEVRWLNARGDVERDARGRATTLNGVVIDVTERHLAEEAREQSEGRFRAFVTASSDAVYRMSPDWSEMRLLVGREFIAGMDGPGRNWLERYIDPEDQPLVLGAIAGAVRAKGLFELEYRARRADGSLGWTASRAVPILDARGQVVEWLGTAADVTERKLAEGRLRASEERYRTLFESMDQGYCVFQVFRDPAGLPVDYRFLEVNPAFEQQTGIQDAAGRRMRQIAPDHDEFWFETYGRVAETGEPIRFQHTGASLEGRSFDLYAFRIGEPAEQKVAVLFTNITHRIRNQAEREMLLGRLTEADRRKDEFLAMLAHELRNPLATISSGLQLVRQAKEPELLSELRELIQGQVEHLAHLIDDLLDVSRISQGKIELRRTTVELADVVRRGAELASQQVADKHHKLTVKLPPGPVRFVADATRVQQVINNLLTNAAKYSEQARSIVLLAGVQGDEVVIRVIDEGFGISAEMLPKVFGLFTQVDATIDRSRGGLGIGLTLVRSLVEMHGGSVEARSEGLGRGSEFVVRLPVGEPRDVAADPAPAPVPTPGRGGRVLIVDDNVPTARITARMLKNVGFAAEVAHDGPEGLDLARRFRPEVVLLDIGLPGMNGYEVAQALRQEPWGPDATLVAVSGYGEEQARERAKAAGFDHHLLKPLDFERLMALIGGRA